MHDYHFWELNRKCIENISIKMPVYIIKRKLSPVGINTIIYSLARSYIIVMDKKHNLERKRPKSSNGFQLEKRIKALDELAQRFVASALAVNDIYTYQSNYAKRYFWLQAVGIKKLLKRSSKLQ